MRAVLVPYPPYGPWDAEADALERVGGSLAVVPYDELVEAPRDAELVLNAWAGALDGDVLDAMPSLRCAVGYGVGTDWIDLDEASRRGIQVVAMRSANVEEVATHSVALLLACVRRLSELDRHVRSGQWTWPRERPLRRLRGRRLGLLAFGSIPRRMAELVAPFGLSVSAHDPFVADEIIRANGVDPVGLDELLRTSDLLSVHVPLTPGSRNLLDAERLSLLPDGAVLVITSRGEVYDAEALATALAAGRVAAAGLDVFPGEPLEPGHALAGLPNAILTPHVAGTSEESIADCHAAAVATIEALATGAAPPGLVNVEVRA